MKEIWCEFFEEFKTDGLPCEEAAREADRALEDWHAETIDRALETMTEAQIVGVRGVC